MLAGTDFALVLVLSDSGARTRNRRSCAAEQPISPPPPPSARPTANWSLGQTWKAKIRLTPGARPAESRSYRPMEYGDSSPFFFCTALGSDRARTSSTPPIFVARLSESIPSGRFTTGSIDRQFAVKRKWKGASPPVWRPERLTQRREDAKAQRRKGRPADIETAEVGWHTMNMTRAGEGVLA